RKTIGEAPTRRRSRGAPAARDHASTETPLDEPTTTNDTDDLRVTRFVVARGVAGREPVGAASSFHAGEQDKIFAFVELANDAKQAGEITVTFVSPSGAAVHRATLEVGADRRWRTWAFTRRPKTPGTWTSVVATGSGRVLARTSFEITP